MIKYYSVEILSDDVRLRSYKTLSTTDKVLSKKQITREINKIVPDFNPHIVGYLKSGTFVNVSMLRMTDNTLVNPFNIKVPDNLSIITLHENCAKYLNTDKTDLVFHSIKNLKHGNTSYKQ